MDEIKNIVSNAKNKNFKKVHKDILPYARELCDRHPDYLKELGILGTYIWDIVNSSNVNSHGHFSENRGRRYINGLVRELGYSWGGD